MYSNYFSKFLPPKKDEDEEEKDKKGKGKKHKGKKKKKQNDISENNFLQQQQQQLGMLELLLAKQIQSSSGQPLPITKYTEQINILPSNNPPPKPPKPSKPPKKPVIKPPKGILSSNVGQLTDIGLTPIVMDNRKSLDKGKNKPNSNPLPIPNLQSNQDNLLDDLVKGGFATIPKQNNKVPNTILKEEAQLKKNKELLDRVNTPLVSKPKRVIKLPVINSVVGKSSY